MAVMSPVGMFDSVKPRSNTFGNDFRSSSYFCFHTYVLDWHSISYLKISLCTMDDAYTVKPVQKSLGDPYF